MDRSHDNAGRDLPLAIRRGASLRCPRCGEGRLFRRYLKQVDSCACCGEDYSYIRADDGPTWLTVLVVGHVVVALAFIVESDMTLPAWVSIACFSTLAVVLSLLLLPRAKGIFIAIIWAQRLARPRPE
jgi:uncharacterized protein (DUF983 family)